MNKAERTVAISRLNHALVFTIDQDRLKKFELASLLTGSHSIATKGTGCIMNWSNFLAGGDGDSDDHPCVSPVIRSFVIRLNDRFTDEERQLLKPYAMKVLGTVERDDKERLTPTSLANEERRRWLAVDHAIRVSAPAWLDAAKLKKDAAKLRALPVVDSSNAESARREARAISDRLWPLRNERLNELKEAVAKAVKKKLGTKGIAAVAADAAVADAAVAAVAAVADAADAADASWYKIHDAVYKAITKRMAPQRKAMVERSLVLLQTMIDVGREA